MIKYDLVGKKFGKLTVLKFAYSKDETRYWECICDCGNAKITRTKSLLNGDTKTCGCSAKTRALKHGLAHTKIYWVWAAIKNRITNSNCKDYKDYGGRGITLDPRWNKFEEFWKDMGKTYKNGLSIDRIDVNGNYCKENCRWATNLEQAHNKRVKIKKKL